MTADPKNAPATIHMWSSARLACVTLALFPLLASPAHADALQHGLWKVTTTPTINGAPSAPQVKMRCVTPEEAADVDKTFSPEVRSANACERVEHEMSGTKLKWKLQCSGQPAMEVTGAFEFDTPQHYTALVTTNVAIGGQSMSSRVTIEGERTGECP